jgi:putative transposase
MPQVLNKVWIHAIWATKYRKSQIDSGIEKILYKFLENQLREQGCEVECINGMPDHVHCLFRLSVDRPLCLVMKQIKGSSSRFINFNRLTKDKFEWQGGYAAYSVTESKIPNVRAYIKNQKEHHKKISSLDEHRQLVEKFKLMERQMDQMTLS